MLEPELLELPLQALLAIADMRDQRPRALLVELDPQFRGARDQPARKLARLHASLPGDLAAGRLDRLAERGRNLVAAILAGEEGDRQAVGIHALHRVADDRDVGLLPP